MRNRFDRDNRRSRPARRAAVPRMHRGREACDAPGGRGMGRRPRFSREEEEDNMGYDDEPMGYEDDDRGFEDELGLEDEPLMDLDLDAILEVDEDEISEEGGCPAGCVPEEDDDKKSDDDDKSDKDDDEKSDDDKSDKDDKKDDDDKGGKSDKSDDDDDKSDKKDDDDKKEDKKEAAVAEKDATTVEPTEATTDEPAVEATTKPATEKPAEPGIDQAKWAPLFSKADVEKLDRSAELLLAPFLNQPDPSYVVMANGRPVGEIRMSDLDKVDPEDRYAMFTAEAFPKGIMKAAEQLGAANILDDLNLRYYASLVTQKQADSAAKTSVQADLEEAFQTRAAALKQDFINNVLLAVEASNKNVFLDNALRDAIRVNFRGAGLPDAVVVDLFEDAMQKSGAAYFTAMVEKADEWLGFEKEALAQIEATIRSAGYQHPADRGLAIEADVAGPPVQHSLPRTMAPAPQQREAAQQQDEWEASEAAVADVMRNAGTIMRGRR